MLRSHTASTHREKWPSKGDGGGGEEGWKVEKKFGESFGKLLLLVISVLVSIMEGTREQGKESLKDRELETRVRKRET